MCKHSASGEWEKQKSQSKSLLRTVGVWTNCYATLHKERETQEKKVKAEPERGNYSQTVADQITVTVGGTGATGES